MLALQGPRADSYRNANKNNSADKKKGKKSKKPDMNELKQELSMVSYLYIVFNTWPPWACVTAPAVLSHFAIGFVLYDSLSCCLQDEHTIPIEELYHRLCSNPDTVGFDWVKFIYHYTLSMRA